MRIYFFSKDLEDDDEIMFYGNGRDDQFTTPEELIADVENFFESPLTDAQKSLIIYEDVPDYDYYSIQGEVDGFGHDTMTVAIFLTKQECINYITKCTYEDKEKFKIIGQYWGQYNDYWG